MTQRINRTACVVGLAFLVGCTDLTDPSDPSGPSSGVRIPGEPDVSGPPSGLEIISEPVTAAVVGKIVLADDPTRDDPTRPEPSPATLWGCPAAEVSVNGSPVTIVLEYDCSFVIDDVQPSGLTTIRVELVDLGVVGSVEVINVADGELIEILVEADHDSLGISVPRRTTPVPADDLPEVIGQNNVSIQLAADIYDQLLTVNGDNFILVGNAGTSCNARTGWTAITDRVVIEGDNAIFRNIRFAGTVELRGHNSRFINSCFGEALVIVENNRDVDDN